MSAFERTLNQHLVSYRSNNAVSTGTSSEAVCTWASFKCASLDSELTVSDVVMNPNTGQDVDRTRTTSPTCMGSVGFLLCMPCRIGAGGIKRYRDPSVCLSVCLSQSAAALGPQLPQAISTLAACSLAMCGLQTRSRTDVDPPRVELPRAGSISSRRHRGDNLLDYAQNVQEFQWKHFSAYLFASLSVSLCVLGTPVSIAKTDEPIEMPCDSGVTVINVSAYRRNRRLREMKLLTSVKFDVICSTFVFSYKRCIVCAKVVKSSEWIKRELLDNVKARKLAYYYYYYYYPLLRQQAATQ